MTETYEDAIAYEANIPYNGSGTTPPAPAGGGYLPEMLYYTRPRKVEENDEAIVMELLMLLDERW